MRDIDEDSDIEDIKKRGKGREMSDIAEDSELKTQEEGKEVRNEILMKIVTLKTSRRGERGER